MTKAVAPARPAARPRFDNSHFQAGVMYFKALMGLYPSARNRNERSAEVAYWLHRCEAAGVDPAEVEQRCPVSVRNEAAAIRRAEGGARD